MGMVAVDPSDTSEVERLHADLAVACGQVNAANAQLVDVVATALTTGAWQLDGIRSPQQWVAWQCGMSTGRASMVCEIASRVAEFPVTFDAFRRGELSIDQVAPIARRAPGWADREACDLAKVLTAQQLSRSLRKYVFPEDPAVGDQPDEAPADPPPDDTTSDDPADTDAGTNGTDSADGEPAGNADPPADPGAGSRSSGGAGVEERVWLHPNEDGTWQFGGILAGDHGELLNQALTEARDWLFHNGQTTVSWVDALIEICNRSLDTIDDTARRDRYHIDLHLELPYTGPSHCRNATITGISTTGTNDSTGAPHRTDAKHRIDAETADDPESYPITDSDPAADPDRDATGSDPPDLPPPQRPNSTADVMALFGPLGHRLPDELRRYLTCDTKITPVWERDGVPVSVGRGQRTVPDRTRRLILYRDGGCRVPGCTHDRWLDIHHLHHWEDGGPTDSWNLVCLCRYHHRLHHLGKLGISGDADDPNGLIFTNQHGRQLHGHITPVTPDGPLPEPAGRYVHPIGEAFRDDDLWFNPPLHLRPHHNNRTA